MLGGIEKGLLAALVLVLMAGMGATLTLAHFRTVVRRPKAVLIGLLSQFGWMPVVAYLLAQGLPSELALGLIIVGCTPGGTTSNLFTYFAKADVALSVTMTAVSTVVAVFAMPSLLALYASDFTGAGVVLPYGAMAKTLVAMLVPVAVGMVVRARSHRAALRLERLGSMAGMLTLVLLIVSGLVRNASLLGQTSFKMVALAGALSLLGMLLGLLSARLLGLAESQARAVSFETGIQNSPLAFAIIIASFPAAQHEQLLWMPMLYALTALFVASCVTVWLRSRAHLLGAAAGGTRTALRP